MPTRALHLGTPRADPVVPQSELASASCADDFGGPPGCPGAASPISTARPGALAPRCPGAP
eukprot:4108150-Pyramimonas_sp.AAC.1